MLRTAAKLPWREELQGARSAVWFVHIIDEQRRRSPAKWLPMRVSPLRPGDFVARLAKDWALLFGTRRVADASGSETRLLRGIEIGSVYGAQYFRAARARDLR